MACLENLKISPFFSYILLKKGEEFQKSFDLFIIELYHLISKFFK